LLPARFQFVADLSEVIFNFFLFHTVGHLPPAAKKFKNYLTFRPQAKGPLLGSSLPV
jgi:hypothetical protein